MRADREPRIVWISEGCKRFLPTPGHDEGDSVGRRVEQVVPHTPRGQPILVGLPASKAAAFLVSRLPLRDERGGVIGALYERLERYPELEGRS